MKINKQDIEKEREIIKELQRQLADKDNEINNLKELRKFEIEDKKELRENQLQEIIRLEKELVEKDKMVDIACSKLVDFEYEQKESVHSAQFWKERLEALAKQELEKEEL